VLRFEPFRGKRDELVSFYRAADVYIHAAVADTFPNTVLEALACGLPGVATAVGGIPEQVRSLAGAPGAGNRFDTKYSLQQATGVLSVAKDSNGLAAALEFVLTDNETRTQLAKNARNDARERFGEERMVKDYLDWYAQILGDLHTKPSC
jgi:glycosyltransferase involved in cell wall biosynthesis